MLLEIGKLLQCAFKFGDGCVYGVRAAKHPGAFRQPAVSQGQLPWLKAASEKLCKD
jgi:hypothetical protein